MSTVPLLDICDLTTWFPIRRGVLARTVGHVRAVDGVSLSIAEGETVGLVGESGCGKTTLARTVVGLDPARSGCVRFEGTEQLDLSARQRLQIIFQDPYASLNPRMTVSQIVTEGLLEHKVITPREREDTAIRLLHDVGMGAEALHRYPHEFSGGQRQRISVARALSLKPRLVICDEPVSALDVSVQAQVINLLAELREKYGLSYLFISHDIGVVRHISDRVAVMYLGRIVEQGPTRDVVDRPRHPYTRALISAVPRARQERRERIVLPGDVPSPANPPPGCRFHPRCPYAEDRCRQTDPPLDAPREDPNRRVACIRKEEI